MFISLNISVRPRCGGFLLLELDSCKGALPHTVNPGAFSFSLVSVQSSLPTYSEYHKYVSQAHLPIVRVAHSQKKLLEEGLRSPVSVKIVSRQLEAQLLKGLMRQKPNPQSVFVPSRPIGCCSCPVSDCRWDWNAVIGLLQLIRCKSGQRVGRDTLTFKGGRSRIDDAYPILSNYHIPAVHVLSQVVEVDLDDAFALPEVEYTHVKK